MSNKLKYADLMRQVIWHSLLSKQEVQGGNHKVYFPILDFHSFVNVSLKLSFYPSMTDYSSLESLSSGLPIASIAHCCYYY